MSGAVHQYVDESQSLASTRWVGVVKAQHALQCVKDAAKAENGSGVYRALLGAMEDASCHHVLAAVLADLVTVTVPFIDIDALCAAHERLAISDAECILRFQRRQRLRQLESIARARAAKAAKRAGQAQASAGAA